jgi:hypothetical protein
VSCAPTPNPLTPAQVAGLRADPEHRGLRHTMAIELDDTETRVLRRTTTPVRNIKATGRGRSPQFLGSVSAITWHESVQPHLAHGKAEGH